MSLFIAAGAVGVTLALSSLSFFALFELKGLDLLFTLRGPLAPPQQIVVVAIDEPSFAEIKQQWPWPRSLHARLLKQLNSAGAKVVGFDILFSEPSDPSQDQAFARTLEVEGNAILVSELTVVNDPLFRHTLRIDPIPLLRNAASVGIPMVSIDTDGVVRRTRIFAEDIPSFAYQVVKAYLDQAQAAASTRGITEISRKSHLQERLIDYSGPPRTVRTVSYYQGLDYETLLPPGIFTDKIVLVGRSTEAIPEPQRLVGDTFLTPFSWVVERPTAGVEIQANIINNLLEGRFIDELGQGAKLFLLLLLVAPASVLLARLNPLSGLLATLILAVAFLVVAWLMFARAGLWLPIFSAIMALCLTYVGQLLVRTIRAERDRLRILEETNRTLEAKVTERTQALLAANQELRERHHQLKKTYQDLSRTQEQLIQSEKMASLGLLVAGVAHELNNPISFVHSNLDFIDEYTERLAKVIQAYDDDNPISEQRRRGDLKKRAARFDETLETLQELITSCKSGAERVKKIVLDLRTFSRTDDIGLMETNLNEGIDSTLNLLTKQYKDRITIHRDYANLPQLECFPGQINQVFMNVLQNALQAIPDKGDVWISTVATEDQVTIIIRDNGIGMDEVQ
ncbi:MAG: CHASE2 domain-containing protein, partial [Candidatus Competibacteraceae bacterium]|nr:CHASE2 domain-containing protein [Candidatus Competibacteraceae bacterium]